MVLAVLIILNALLSVNASPHKDPCVGKAVGDPCVYTNDRGICCTMIRNQAKVLHKFCRECEWKGHPVHSECTQRTEYIGCFRRPEDGIVFQVCHGQKKGSPCMYETKGYSRGGKTKAGYNTTGTCMAHYDHGKVMCLEAVGDKDDGECEGKGVGTLCTPKDSTSASAMCVHDSSRGRWECMVPKEEKMKFVVCQGQDPDTPCRFNDAEKGLVQGVCYAHDDDDGGMMCGTPVSDDDTMNEENQASGAPMTTAVSSLGFAYALIVIASVACTN